jgi:hypothetical protein
VIGTIGNLEYRKFEVIVDEIRIMEAELYGDRKDTIVHISTGLLLLLVVNSNFRGLWLSQSELWRLTSILETTFGITARKFEFQRVE